MRIEQISRIITDWSNRDKSTGRILDELFMKINSGEIAGDITKGKSGAGAAFRCNHSTMLHSVMANKNTDEPP